MRFNIDSDRLDSIVLSKAGFLGVPKGEYQVGDIQRMAGQRVQFTWEQD